MYPTTMKLSTARLCLDCDDVHDEQHCPSCGSESFAFLARWVDPGGQRPSARRGQAAAAADPERLEAVRALTAPAGPAPGGIRRILGAVAGVATVGVAGWIWSRSREAARRGGPQTPADPDAGPGPSADGRDLL